MYRFSTGTYQYVPVPTLAVPLFCHPQLYINFFTEIIKFSWFFEGILIDANIRSPTVVEGCGSFTYSITFSQNFHSIYRYDFYQALFKVSALEDKICLRNVRIKETFTLEKENVCIRVESNQRESRGISNYSAVECRRKGCQK